jgi:glycosyltransferase involved in cell wall biosynthesis
MFVAAYIGSPVFGGAEKGQMLLLSELQRRGHRAKFYLKSRQLVPHVEPYAIESEVLRLGGDVVFTDALRFAAALRRDRPDALLIGTFQKMWLGGMGAHLAGVPRVVAKMLLSTDIPNRWKYRVALRNWIDISVLNTETIRAPYLAAVPGLEPARVVTIYDSISVPEPRCTPGELRRSLGLPPEAQVFGAVARLAEQKRFDRLVRALAVLPHHVHCILAGEGGEQEPLASLSAELGVRSRLHLLGFRSDVADVLDALDVFVVSSDLEGMSNAMLEALSVGLPVISTPVSGAAEALDPLTDGVAPGEIVDFGYEAIAAALARLLADPERRRLMGEAAIQRSRERFSLGRMLDQWETVLFGDPAALGSHALSLNAGLPGTETQLRDDVH